MIFMGLLSSIMRMNSCRETDKKIKPIFMKSVPLADKLDLRIQTVSGRKRHIRFCICLYIWFSVSVGKEDTLNENKIDKTGEKLDTL